MGERPHDPGTILYDLLVEVVLALNRSDATYAVCGGMAMASHGFIRATDDLDVLLATTADVARADAVLAPSGWFNASAVIEFPDSMTLHRRLKLIGREFITLDLLVQAAGDDLLGDRERSDVFGAAGYVVSSRALTLMKRRAGRPQDLVDLAHLEQRHGQKPDA